ncbi:hypothetical protein HLB23_24565 [Nocardia uniformis]|uniref:Uncharacterized protein n=1 Tax=Nocardia uniformis TaxID=53432 RepID=A0A849C9M1_9NOCA|nr:hypothetical protein [Nocardia uniformis]NNH72995.1 hypothetical protein [Nocardia uniformis]
MTTPESAADQAAALEEAVFRLYDQANTVGDDANTLADVADLMLETFEAEQRLQTFLSEKTDDLAEHPVWQGYYNKFAVQVSHPMTAIACFSIDDAFARAAEHIAAHHKAVPADHLMLVEIHRAGSDTSIFRFLDKPDHAADHVRTGADEHLAATALTMVRSRVEQGVTAGSTVGSGATVGDLSRVREIVGHKPSETLIARWAVAEGARPDTPNPWEAHLEKAGLCLQAVRQLADCEDLIGIDRVPRHPVAQERFRAVDQLITHYLAHSAEAEATTTSVDHEIAARTDQATDIQHLINTAHSYGPRSTTECSVAQELPDIERSSAATEPEVEM